VPIKYYVFTQIAGSSLCLYKYIWLRYTPKNKTIKRSVSVMTNHLRMERECAFQKSRITNVHQNGQCLKLMWCVLLTVVLSL
jgi:hypothetical protein